jgi:hypothetical protein
MFLASSLSPEPTDKLAVVSRDYVLVRICGHGSISHVSVWVSLCVLVEFVERWSVEQNDWIATCVILKTREKKQDN